MPPPRRRRVLRSRLVSPNRRLKARTDIQGSRSARSGSRLTAWAVVGRSAGQPDALDQPAAIRARLTCPAVGEQFALIPPAPAIAADVVADRRAACSDGSVEHRDDRPPQPLG